MARIYSPDNNFVDIRMRNPDYVFNRGALDNHIVDMALSEGAEIIREKRFTGYKAGKNDVDVFFGDEKINAEYLIGADGANSTVAKLMGVGRTFLYGVQARAEMKMQDTSLYTVYLGMGDFAWIVPENDKIARVGIIGNKDEVKKFNDFMDKKGCKMIEYQGGLVPLYNPRLRIQQGRVMIIGDAATQVKPTTYGGIVPGMMAARQLAKNPDEYEVNFRKTVGKDLKLGLRIRKMLNKFKLEDYNRLVKLCKQDRVIRILNNANRDYPSSFMLKLMIAEPRFMRYALQLIK